MIKIVFTCAMVMGLMACSANYNSIYRNFDVGKGQSAMVDIRQRAVLVAPYEKQSVDEHSKPVTEKGAFVCAEPSPDAMAALAYELAIKGDVAKKGNVEIGHAMNDSAAFTGLRTQSIQLLRDFGYRLCESRMSGAITNAQYDLLMRRFQKNTVALLAIEQLTGALKVPPIALTASGKAEATKSLADQRAEREKIADQIALLEKDGDEKKSEKERKEKEKDALVKAGQATEEVNAKINGLDKEIKALDDEITAISEKIGRLKDDMKAVDKAIAENKGLLAEGRTDVTIKTDVVSGQRSDEHIQKVADVVKEIVNNIVLSDDDKQICMSVLQSNQVSDSGFKEWCNNLLQTRLNAESRLATEILKNLEALRELLAKAPPAERPAILRQIEDLTGKLEDLTSGSTVGLYRRGGREYMRKMPLSRNGADEK